MGKRANHARSFNSVMHYLQEEWAARVLGMEVNPGIGIDLIGSKADIETKFRLQKSGKYAHLSWRVLEYQMEYSKDSAENGKAAFWGLAKYWLKVPIEKIKTKNPEELESLVAKREIYIVEWKWMLQFPAYHQSGRTQFSEWNHKIRFPKGRLLPKTTRTYNAEKGLVHLTEGVDENILQIIKP